MTILRRCAPYAMLLQKLVPENGAAHHAPANPGEKVHGLISLTINNALVGILRDTQKSIAIARQGAR